MSTLQSISIRVEHDPSREDAVIAHSILHEIQTLLERLLAEGQGGTIDLRSLPALSPASIAMLEQSLSVGEVSALVTAVGRTEVRETTYSGVWWLVHRNERDDIVTELIQVTAVPEILLSQTEDIEAGLRRLNDALSSVNGEEFMDRPADEVVTP